MIRNFKNVAALRDRPAKRSTRPGPATRSGAGADPLFREYYYLYRIAATLTADVDMGRTLQEAKKVIRASFRPQQFAVLLLEPGGTILRCQSQSGFRRARAQRLDLAGEDRLFGKILQRRQHVYIADLNTRAVHYRSHPLIRHQHGAFLALPLFLHGQGRALGLLYLYRRQAHSFTPLEIHLLRKIAGQLAQVLDKIALYHQTRALSITDPLTGIFNRRHFNERYATEFMRAARYQRPLSLVMIDIDHFKKFNDSHGHLWGDKILRMAAQVLEENIRKADLLARYGGEEFVIILPEIDKAHGQQVAEKLRRAIAQTIFPKAEHQPFGRLTISAGLASFPEDAQEDGALLAQADRALYDAKARGRNQVVVAPEMKPERRKPARASFVVSR